MTSTNTPPQSSEAVSAVLSTRAPSAIGVRRYIIPVGLLLIMTLGYADRVNFSVAAPLILAEFGLTKAAFGWLSSSFNWSYLLLLIPMGALSDRIGTRLILLIFIVVWSLGAGITGMAGSLTLLFVSRLVLGVGESPINPAGNLVVREWAPASERGFFAGMLNTGALVGPAVGSVVAAQLIESFGWRASFFALGGFGVLVGILWFAIYETPERARWLGAEERTFILANREINPEPGRKAVRSMTVLSLLQTKSMWGLIITQGCAVYTNYLFLSFLPLYLVDIRGLKNIGAGWATGVTYGLAAVGSLVIVAISDRWVRRHRDNLVRARRTSLLVTLALALVLLALPWLSSTGLIITAISWVLAFAFAAIALNWALASDLVVDKGSVGRLFALITIGGNALGLAAPIVTGYLIDWTKSYSLPFIIAALLLIVGMGVTAALSRTPLQPARQAGS
ncbi:MAG: MFS transporter [Rhodopila sp.]|nr:MFS transporter [Rhodopila sp.]